MNLIPVNLTSIEVGQPLPFQLVDRNGVLLAAKFFIVKSRDDLAEVAEKVGGLYMDGVDAEALQKAYVDQMQTMMRQDKPLGEIATTKIPRSRKARSAAVDLEKVDWFDLQVQANHLLRDLHPVSFVERLEHIHSVLGYQIERHADSALFALIHLSASETRMYSATHGMLVSVICGLASREVLQWPPAAENLLRKAALTMNIGMTDLQDRLALQKEAPTSEQRSVIQAHAAQSAGRLMQLGITDPTWLGAVREHHTQTPGPLRSKKPAQRLARLIQRADMFAARLAPRASRAPISPAAAMQACYFDEQKAVDEAGAAIIKAVGIYQPGAFVKLATDEIAVVTRRAANTSTPRVAVLVNRSGMPTGEPLLRNTSQENYRIVASVPHREVKVKIQLERMLALTTGPVSDRTG
jgi:HD-GYP domain-containing protein (c-di-GMP phosphodiesterase class II)